MTDHIQDAATRGAKLPASASFNCPVCGKPLDLQGTDRSGYGWYSFDLWCHACVAHITLRLKKNPREIAKEKT